MILDKFNIYPERLESEPLPKMKLCKGGCGRKILVYNSLKNKCFDCTRKAHKPIKKQSKKQQEYERWLRNVARPFLIERDGEKCSCCGILHYPLDIEHTKGKGSHAELKRDLNNMTLMGRFPCHRNKTDNKPCPH